MNKWMNKLINNKMSRSGDFFSFICGADDLQSVNVIYTMYMTTIGLALHHVYAACICIIMPK